MSNWLVAIIGLVYAYVGLEQAYKGNPGGAVMWLSYATANGGMILGGFLK